MKQGTKRRVLVIVGSDSDILSQCSGGLRVLIDEVRQGTIEMVEGEVRTMSVHRNHAELVVLLKDLHERKAVDIIIAGAGWAAHLPGMVDAILGYDFGHSSIHVVGVAFEDQNDESHTTAAELSISKVPGTRVIYEDDGGDNFVGASGFYRACEFAATGELPEISVPKARESKVRSLIEAIDFCTEKLKT
jgi:phosphoribosylcarboxyaminoimidazole (NCAIR) mutase